MTVLKKLHFLAFFKDGGLTLEIGKLQDSVMFEHFVETITGVLAEQFLEASNTINNKGDPI